MTIKQISSRDNPRFKQLKRLSESARERRQTGKTLLDGVHLLQTYLTHYGEPEFLLIAQGESNHEVTDFIQMHQDLPTLMFPTLMLAELAPVATPSGLMALIDIPQLNPPDTTKFILLLEDIQDPGNLGSILRSALAAGVDAVYLSTGCCDVWSPKALRGGQGAQLMLPVIERADLAEVARQFQGQVLATSMQGNNVFQMDLRQPTAFIMGNEGAGVSAQLLQHISQQVSIPMHAQMESLNVAAACAIFLFERLRQTSQDVT